MALKISLELRSFPGFSRSSPFSFLCSISQTRSYRQCVKKVDYQQRIQEHTKSFVRRLGYAAIIGTCGFSLYSYLKENGLSLEHWSVHAKESNDSKFRKQYSFIADVVEKVNNSVVLIECQGAGFFHTRGSGFIISKDGLIVTNAHVIANGTSGKVIVTLKDKRVFQAVIQKIDEYADLAILKIHCDGLPALPMGSVSDLRAGEWVVAIGSPLHLTNSVTVGVVSSPERHAREVGGLTDIKYIQTDASITHGNSGGPLVNLDGEAIGVNSLAIKPGIAFAVPVEHVKMLLDGSITESLKGKVLFTFSRWFLAV
ncbi:UNVERIFIED_CONTAM: hypothetical protein PYX00_004729 [Menopon gallinae]|uniref:Serine protease n=1 Tax=Menopon gallinae TaxID=328185 RepID=A0AAW2I6P2_9NEOP